MNKNELVNIKGGKTSATTINAIIRTLTTVLEVGRIVGTALKRKFKSTCN